MDTFTALIVLAVLAMLFAGGLMAFGQGLTRSRTFVDEDADGEPDETPEEKARAMRELADDKTRKAPPF